jgi:fatty-acyl-CoA synthase
METITASDNYAVVIVRRLSAHGSGDAIVAGERRVSGGEAAAAVLRFAAALRGSGLTAGDGVALFVANSPEVVLLQLAVHFIGCRLVFVPPEPGNGELEALIERAEVGMLLFDPVFEERTRQITERISIPRVLSVGSSSIAPDFLTLASGARELAIDEAADGTHVATLLYTGGTTGAPKLAVHRSRYYTALLNSAGTYVHDASTSRAVVICTLVTHTSGHSTVLIGIMTGQTLVLLRTFDAGAALSVMESERATAVVVVPPMLYDLLDHPDCRSGRFRALTSVAYTGAAASPARLRQAIERFGPVLYQVYGTTEVPGATHLTPLEHDLERPELLSSCGRPMPGVEVEVRDGDGRPVPAGEPGELYIRSSLVMEGYWNDPERTAEVLDGEGWFRSGDIARLDDDGYVYLVGRSRDIIVTGRTSDNVYSRLLDDLLAAQPAVKDAATIGLPGADALELVHVVLVPRDPAAPPDLARLTREITGALGDLYAPVSYSIADALPRTTIGKVDKTSLRAAVLDGELPVTRP